MSKKSGIWGLDEFWFNLINCSYIWTNLLKIDNLGILGFGMIKIIYPTSDLGKLIYFI